MPLKINSGFSFLGIGLSFFLIVSLAQAKILRGTWEGSEKTGIVLQDGKQATHSFVPGAKLRVAGISKVDPASLQIGHFLKVSGKRLGNVIYARALERCSANASGKGGSGAKLKDRVWKGETLRVQGRITNLQPLRLETLHKELVEIRLDPVASQCFEQKALPLKMIRTGEPVKILFKDKAGQKVAEQIIRLNNAPQKIL